MERLVARVKSARELPALLSALEELEATLSGHFLREESPQGLHGLVSRRAPEFQSAFDRLMKEHDGFRRGIASIAERVRRGEGGEAVEAAARLAADLKEHELRENEIARAALDPHRAAAR